jgi:hypothetical protein
VEALEERIEDLAETARGCRKLILLSKFAAAGGLLLLVLAFLGYGAAVPMLVFGVAALVGGMVLGGSNVGTLRRTEEAIGEAEALRAGLIDGAGIAAAPAGMTKLRER